MLCAGGNVNTTPLGSHKTMSDYAKFLFTRFVLTQFKRGCHEVHVIFDNPGRLQNTPKYFEQTIAVTLSAAQPKFRKGGGKICFIAESASEVL